MAIEPTGLNVPREIKEIDISAKPWDGSQAAVIEPGIYEVSQPWLGTEESKITMERLSDSELLARIGPDTPACNLARAVLADPHDALKWGVLLDAVQEAFHAAGDVERSKAKFEADLLAARNAAGIINVLLSKLRDLGYGDVLDRSVVKASSLTRNWITIDAGEVEYRNQTETFRLPGDVTVSVPDPGEDVRQWTIVPPP